MRAKRTLPVLLLVMLMGLLSTTAHSQQNSQQSPPQSENYSASIEAAMAALDEFMLTFNRRDMEAWASSLNYPHVRLASGRVTVNESKEDYMARDVFPGLVSSGWDHSHWLSRDVIMASADKVHIATVFQRFNSDNEPIASYQSLYIVTNVDGHWGTQARSSLAP